MGRQLSWARPGRTDRVVDGNSIHFNEQETSSKLEQLLASVVTLEKAEKGLWDVLEAFLRELSVLEAHLNVLLRLQFTLGDPLNQVLSAGFVLLCKIHDDEPLHSQSLLDDREVVLGSLKMSPKRARTLGDEEL
jgi:hypothetical protein